jgi:hypothetical protein
LIAKKSGTTVTAELTGFVNRLTDPIEILDGGTDTYSVGQGDGSVVWAGIGLALGWRTSHRQGVYASFSPVIQTAGVSTQTAGGTDLVLDGLASSLPEFFGSARLGFRGQYFRGDLDADLHLVGRFWSSFHGRTYNPTHAIMALAEPDARPVSSSGTVDIRLEAGIREATLYVSVDNVLAGLLYSGAMVVPVYPLPDRAFRFGVKWPIWN